MLFYPHGLYLNSATFIGQADDVVAELNVDELSVLATGDTMPGFTGGKKTEPEFRLDTTAVDESLSFISSGDEDFVRAVTAGNCDIMYRKAKDQATRWAVGSSKHIIYRMIQSAMLYWESLEVAQDNEAKINLRMVATYASGQPTLTLLKEQTIPAASAVTKVYTLGKVYLNGSQLTRVKKVSWNNKPTIAKESADGEPQPGHVSIDKAMPSVQIDTQNLESIQAFGESGTALDGSNGLVVYLRRRQQGTINYPDATATHIKLQATHGSVFWSRTGGDKSAAQLNVALQRPSNGGAVWVVTRNVAIA